MKPLPPFRVDVYNRAAQEKVGEFYANQVPQRGDVLNFFGRDVPPESPFHLWGQWRVDEVVWEVAHATSVSALRLARETDGDIAASYCDWVEVHCWPAQGPYWYDTPKWAKTVQAPEDDDEDEEPTEGAQP